MNVSQSLQMSFTKSLAAFKRRKDLLYIFIFTVALIAFEAFNFSTTDFALSDLLGDLRFAGIRWAALLSIAFCGIDFAGIARLFAPQSSQNEGRSVWFMFGAWFLAATMNTILTWWGVVMAMQTHPMLSASMVDATFVSKVVPIFIALMVWVVRILLVGALSKKGERLLRSDDEPVQSVMSRRELRQAQSRAAQAQQSDRSVPAGFNNVRAKPSNSGKRGYHPEPTYIPMQEEAAFRSLKRSVSGKRRV